MSVRLEARGLTVRFDGQPVATLKGLQISLSSGSFTVVVGPSGCGKSTLLNTFAGLIPPTEGDVLHDSVPVVRPGPERGIVFQRDVLFPWMDIEDNLAFALRAERVGREDRAGRIAELLESVQLPLDVRNRRPYELSGGMRQRVGIARMLAGSPDVMLMDEPFGALDAQTRLQMQDLFIEIWGQTEATVLFVTHDVDEAIRLADRIIVLGNEGIVRADLGNPIARPRPAAELGGLRGYTDLRRHLHRELLDTSAPGKFTGA